ncbi:hypothetical protein J2T57_001449 [Natronocella acetinitrilica]|uniref:Uncharacterized protein n=1 Tax=Natronocella acetinitrilica TaxID=414046 RepID=A0AAE3KFR2_9GAMM|nr:hypothetical protein [Natronocella acetinitrilica]MCP1674347.1 hypothetical protein [Natronocella acetinitrilica]
MRMIVSVRETHTAHYALEVSEADARKIKAADDEERRVLIQRLWGSSAPDYVDGTSEFIEALTDTGELISLGD